MYLLPFDQSCFGVFIDSADMYELSRTLVTGSSLFVLCVIHTINLPVQLLSKVDFVKQSWLEESLHYEAAKDVIGPFRIFFFQLKNKVLSLCHCVGGGVRPLFVPPSTRGFAVANPKLKTTSLHLDSIRYVVAQGRSRTKPSDNSFPEMAEWILVDWIRSHVGKRALKQLHYVPGI